MLRTKNSLIALDFTPEVWYNKERLETDMSEIMTLKQENERLRTALEPLLQLLASEREDVWLGGTPESGELSSITVPTYLLLRVEAALDDVGKGAGDTQRLDRLEALAKRSGFEVWAQDDGTICLFFSTNTPAGDDATAWSLKRKDLRTAIDAAKDVE